MDNEFNPGNDPAQPSDSVENTSANGDQNVVENAPAQGELSAEQAANSTQQDAAPATEQAPSTSELGNGDAQTVAEQEATVQAPSTDASVATEPASDAQPVTEGNGSDTTVAPEAPVDGGTQEVAPPAQEQETSTLDASSGEAGNGSAVDAEAVATTTSQESLSDSNVDTAPGPESSDATPVVEPTLEPTSSDAVEAGEGPQPNQTDLDQVAAIALAKQDEVATEPQAGEPQEATEAGGAESATQKESSTEPSSPAAQTAEQNSGVTIDVPPAVVDGQAQV